MWLVPWAKLWSRPYPIPPSKQSIYRSRLLIFIPHLTFEISHIPNPASILSAIPHTAKSMLGPSGLRFLRWMALSAALWTTDHSCWDTIQPITWFIVVSERFRMISSRMFRIHLVIGCFKVLCFGQHIPQGNHPRKSRENNRGEENNTSVSVRPECPSCH